jgi:hypothetical protein
MSSNVDILSRTNEDLTSKIIYLERELESQSLKSSKSVSIHNSTQESRKTELEKDRLITNMKIVHESELRRMKLLIVELRG